MTDMRCPECGSELRVAQLGASEAITARQGGGLLGADPALTIADCPECGRNWERRAAGPDNWRPGSNIN